MKREKHGIVPVIRIAHLSVMRQLHVGIRVQLGIEAQVAEELDGIEWKTVAVHDGLALSPHEVRTPAMFRLMFLRNIFGWLVAIRLSRKVDFVLFRHIPFDPFSLIFARFVPNRIPIHHSKEIDELPNVAPGWRGRWASRLERLAGKFSTRHALAVGAVTNEIADFECKLHGVNKETVIYPNGIAISDSAPVADARRSDSIELFFSCSAFSNWHGLDYLIEAVDESVDLAHKHSLRIHLVGSLLPGQLDQLTQSEARRNIFRIHGTVDMRISQRELMPRCHVGLASLALERKNLREGSTLKVREMLAAGLPVYSTHVDASLNDAFPFYFRDERVNLRNIVAFASAMRGYTRDQVSNSSVQFISKRASMEHVAEVLAQRFRNT